jgi:hypothetical protein
MWCSSPPVRADKKGTYFITVSRGKVLHFVRGEQLVNVVDKQKGWTVG